LTHIRKIIPLHLTEKAKRGKLFAHLSPGILLLLIGVEALISGTSEHLWLDLLSIAAGLGLLFLLRREIKGKSGHVEHPSVHWFEVVAGAVLVLEGVHHLHPGHWFQPGVLTILVGAAVAAMGIFSRRLDKLQRLEISAEGFYLRPRMISRLRMRWDELKDARLDGTTLSLQTKAGTERRISLRRIQNREEVLKALKEGLLRQAE
jgi:hypothetical protein